MNVEAIDLAERAELRIAAWRRIQAEAPELAEFLATVRARFGAGTGIERLGFREGED